MVDRCVAKDPADRPLADEVSRGMLPTLTSEVEWPPPGLHWLHGRSQILSRLALATFAGAILTLTALAFTPQILQTHSNWLFQFQNPSSRDPVSVTLFLWQTELILGVSVLALSLFVLPRARRGRGCAAWCGCAAPGGTGRRCSTSPPTTTAAAG